MKKGFTMIELIFVIVILGILASVAIPRLAGTREDAEISTAVANLRTLLGDAASYYVVKGSFGTANWNEFTNVPLSNAATQAVSNTATANLKVGGKNCIAMKLVDRTVTATATAPAYIVFAKKSGGGDVCTQVQNAAPVRAYFDSRVEGINLEYGDNKGAIAIGSSTTIY